MSCQSNKEFEKIIANILYKEKFLRRLEIKLFSLRRITILLYIMKILSYVMKILKSNKTEEKATEFCDDDLTSYEIPESMKSKRIGKIIIELSDGQIIILPKKLIGNGKTEIIYFNENSNIKITKIDCLTCRGKGKMIDGSDCPRCN